MSASLSHLSIKTFGNPFELYTDSRSHGYQGSTRNVRLARVTPQGGGSIAKSEDGMRCAVTGRESLRILRISESSETNSPEHKYAVGRGGHRIDASRNFWDGSGLKIDSASTDVAWGHGVFNNKVLTSARNGELIMWDLNKSGSTKYERRTKDHIRSIHKMAVSHIVHNYCVTGSADGHMRIWDLRDISKSIMRVHYPTSVRSVVFSPSLWLPLQIVVGLDNGSIYRWDLKMGQRGQVDRLPVAHTASITALDWCSAGGVNSYKTSAIPVQGDPGASGLGWLVSGGLDRCVKIWDLTAPGENTHIPQKPTYTLHPSFAVRRLTWRPGYQCELAISSTTEYSTPAMDLNQLSSGAGSSGLLTRVGSGLGLDSIMRGGFPDSLYSVKEKFSHQAEPAGVNSLSPIGDAVEIWDVRRGWLAKWSVAGSSREGGVTDISFGDSHALWTQSTSGAFSQIDLRDATKPIDAIPRVAAAWEASGSMTFVVDAKDRWEVPYDDIRPDYKNTLDLPKPPMKSLGDPSSRLATQTLGTYAPDALATDLEVLSRLARKYIFEGRDRGEICAYNSGVAFAAGHEIAAQVWLLLGAALTQYIPEFPPTPPLSPVADVSSPLLPPSPQVPRPTSGYSFPSSSASKTAESSPISTEKISPARRSTSGSLTRISSQPPSSSRKLTPTSSTSSSPRHLPTALPSTTPRRASFFGRRESIDAGSISTAGMFRRPSLPPSASNLTVSSPVDRSTPSLRHVGEGVLDDSDSSGGDEDEGEDTAGNSSDDGAVAGVPPELSASRAVPLPSPLSRGHQAWTEDEEEGGKDDEDDDDASSPSPQSSTDSDSHGSSSSDERAKSAKVIRKGSIHFKARSRSSTLASFAASHPRPLIHQDSHGSIRTVTGAENSMREPEEIKSNETIATPQIDSQDAQVVHNRQKSLSINEPAVITSQISPALDNEPKHQIAESFDFSNSTERRIEIIRLDDKKFEDATFLALQSALEDFAELGDVQMCAMLSLVAPRELCVSTSRVRRFVESYIDILTRLRLYTSAAYLRKYCNVDPISRPTTAGTTIYTSCGKCRKTLVLTPSSSGSRADGTFSFCVTCRVSVVNCSICRLPVHSLLFQCSICHHGGHQACYRQYYLQQPMVDLPSSFRVVRGSRGRIFKHMASATRQDEEATDTSSTPSPNKKQDASTLAGHPCAAGCGHFCWAANREWDSASS